MNKTDYYIKYSNELHNNEFEYLTEYINSKIPIKMRCKVNNHTFSLSPDSHLNKLVKCPTCAKNSIPNLTSLISEFHEIHQNKYNYDKFVYVNSNTKGCIVCPKHGEFWKSPDNHKHKTKPQGCPACSLDLLKNNMPWTKSNFIKCCTKNNRISFILYYKML